MIGSWRTDLGPKGPLSDSEHADLRALIHEFGASNGQRVSTGTMVPELPLLGEEGERVWYLDVLTEATRDYETAARERGLGPEAQKDLFAGRKALRADLAALATAYEKASAAAAASPTALVAERENSAKQEYSDSKDELKGEFHVKYGSLDQEKDMGDQAERQAEILRRGSELLTRYVASRTPVPQAARPLTMNPRAHHFIIKYDKVQRTTSRLRRL